MDAMLVFVPYKMKYMMFWMFIMVYKYFGVFFSLTENRESPDAQLLSDAWSQSDWE